MQSKHIFIKALKLFVFFILVAALFPLGKYIFKYSPDTVPLEGDLNYGLNEEVDALTLANYRDDIKGHLYFSLVEMDEANEPVNVNVHSYDLQTEIPRPVIGFGTNHSLYPVSENIAAVVAALEDNSGEVHEVPIWLNTETSEYGFLETADGYTPHRIAGFPGQEWGAASFVKEDSSDKHDLKNWKIIIEKPAGGESVVIEGATSPQWMNEGNDLVYIKTDGIYRYNLEAGVSELIFNVYQGLSSDVEIAVSPQNDYMVLTLPSVNTISVIQIDDATNGVIREIGRVQTKGRQYITPTVSSSGRFYAVVGRDADNLSNSVIEIWSARSREPLKTISLDDYIPGQIYLSAWVDFALIPELNENDVENGN